MHKPKFILNEDSSGSDSDESSGYESAESAEEPNVLFPTSTALSSSESTIDEDIDADKVDIRLNASSRGFMKMSTNQANSRIPFTFRSKEAKLRSSNANLQHSLSRQDNNNNNIKLKFHCNLQQPIR